MASVEWCDLLPCVVGYSHFFALIKAQQKGNCGKLLTFRCVRVSRVPAIIKNDAVIGRLAAFMLLRGLAAAESHCHDNA